jgi:phospholipid/cholesterol/gamma-HCH transport system substrate-binding protein
MENKAHALAAGAFVLVVAGLLVALAVWLTREAGAVRSYEISTRDAVTGLQSQASVRFRGVNVGKVASLGFDPLYAGQVLIRIEVATYAPITRTTYATLGYQGLTGIAFVQLDDSGESREPPVAEAGQLARIPMRPSLLDQWSRQGERILGQLEDTTRRVNELLAPENQRALRRSLDQVAAAAAAVPPAMERAGASFQAMREAAGSVSAGAAQVRAAAADYARLAQRVQEPGGALDQLQQGAGALAGTGQAVRQSSLPRLNRALDDTSRSAQRIGRAAARLDENPQGLIYGPPLVLPGPGEPGFVVPGAVR